MCRLLGGRWGLYAWRQRQGAPEKQAAENAQLSAEIQAVLQAVLQEHRGFYGSPRIHQELRYTASGESSPFRQAHAPGRFQSQDLQALPALLQGQQRSEWRSG